MEEEPTGNNEEAPVKTPAAEGGDPDTGHLFPPETGAEEGKKPKKEKPKKDKPKRPHVTWTTSGLGKFLTKVSNGVEGVIDGLWDDIDE